MIRKEIRQTLKLAGPIILAQLAQVSMTFVDTVMVGWLGTRQLAGVALGGAVLFPLVVVSLGILMAVGPMVAQGHGGGDRKAIKGAVRQGLWLATLLAVAATLAVWQGSWLLRWSGQEEEMIVLAEGYLRAIMWGVAPHLWFAVLRCFMEGLSRPRVVLVVTVGGLLLNVAGNYVLMYGKLGFPALGLVGCGWASTLVYWTMFLAMVFFVRRSEGLRSYRLLSRLSRPDWHQFLEVFRIGWPIGAMLGFEVGLFSATALLMGLFGKTALAAHQIALQCAGYTYMVPLGLSLAVSVRVGQAIGRRDLEGARRAGHVGMGLGPSFMVVAALCFWLFPRSIVSLFLDTNSVANNEVVLHTVGFLTIAAIFQVFDGLQATAAGALRGLKDTRTPMIVALVAYWIVGLSSGYLLAFQFGWQGTGLWWGLVLGLSTAALLLFWRFNSQVRAAIDPGRDPHAPR